jgi:hypothetical protein
MNPVETTEIERLTQVRAGGPVALGRAVLVLAAVAAVLVGAPVPVTAALTLTALVAVAERLSRTRAQPALDAVLVAFGGTLIGLILVGLVLGVTGIGLRATSWAIAGGAVALVGLGLAEGLAPASRRRPSWLRVPAWTDVAWALVVGSVVVLALVVSVRATDRGEVAPVQMSFGAVAATTAQIVVTADRPTGQLELRTQASDGTSLSYPLFSVEPGRSLTTSVVLPETGRFIITLNNPAQTAPLRSLILDR